MLPDRVGTYEVEVRKPLRLGEVIAAAIRLFALRPLPSLAIGGAVAATFLLIDVLPIVAFVAIVSIVFALGLAVTTRLVEGDGLGDALRRIPPLLPDLLVLAFVVAVPFYLASLFVILLIAGAAWLALTVFAVPVAVLDKPAEERFLANALNGMRETVRLSRVAYLHAFGVVAALVAVQIVFSIVLGLLLSGYADNSRLAAQALTQVVLAPFFFLGLSVLYFEQRARAAEIVSGKPSL